MIAAERAHMRSHCQTRIYAALARNRLTAGDLAAADQALALGLTASQAHGHCGICESLLLPAAASIRVAQADLAWCGSFGQPIDEAALRYDSRAWLALVSQARGEIEATATYFKEAQTGFQTAGNEVEISRCQEALARLGR